MFHTTIFALLFLHDSEEFFLNGVVFTAPLATLIICLKITRNVIATALQSI